MIYRKRPETVDATQWFTNGDHPGDGRERFADGEFEGELLEGRIVRYFRRPDVPGETACHVCGREMRDHGWIDGGGDGRVVCPGDFIITLPDGYVPMRPDVFIQVYAKAHEG